MKKSFHTALALGLFACASILLTVPATAQSVYGSLFGTVSDKTGAAVAGATVTIKDEAKGTVVTVISNASGDYTVPHLIPDIYDLKVSAKGFKSFEAKGIGVEADTAPRIDPTLDVGGSSETVEVNADTQPQLKTESTDVSTVFDQQQVSSLPVGDQNFTNLQLLLPGAQLLGWSHAADENPQGSKQIQVDGQAFGGTAFELDGTDNEDPILGIIVINPALDAVTETKITTQNFDAELGKAVSAVVTAQTRSGTNTFHGSAYDFRTGNANYARDPYSVTPGKFDPLTNPSGLPAGLKNRLGASIGGPALKDRLFFFGNYEAQRQKVGTSATDTLPTSLLTETALGNNTTSAAQMAAGYKGADFSEYLAQFGLAGTLYPTTPAEAAAAGVAVFTPYPDNVVPTSLLSPQALNLLKLLEPSTAGVGRGIGLTGSENGLDQNFKQSGTGLFNSNQWTERVDYTINEKMHAFERFSRFWDTLSGKVMFGTAGGPGFGSGNYGGNSNGANDSLASGMDIALSPKLLTDFRLGYYRYNVIDTKHDQGVEEATALGINGINIGGNITSGSPGFNITNVPGGSGGTNGTVYGDGLGINRCNCPLTEREDQFQIVNNWTRIIGNHAIKVGADLRYGRNLRVPSDNDRAGLMNFGTGPESWPSIPNDANGKPQPQGGLGFASFLMGDVTSFNRYVSTSTNAKEFQKRTFFYGQDTWRVTRSLTLNLGLRWDMYFPESVNGPGNGALLNISDGYLHVAGIGGVPSDLGWTVDKAKQFSPRLGVTYQMDPKTVIRAGYGRSFDTGVFGSTFGHTVTQNIPVLANQQINSPSNIGEAFNLSSATGPTPYAPVPVPADGLLPNPGSQVSSSSRPNPMHLTTIDAWNLSVQRSLTPTLSITAAYVGNKGTHTLGDGDSNGTNPNEAAITLPGANSYNGQTLHYDPSVKTAAPAANGGTSTTQLLQRYFAATLKACSDPNYVSPGSPYAGVALPAGACGWTNSIAYRGDDQNTEFDALQVNVAQTMKNGLTMNANYEWAKAFDEESGYYTWSHVITHGQDSNVRDQQLTLYGSYDLPFGKGKQYLPGAGRTADLVVGGWQVSDVSQWSGGLPYTLGYNESGNNIDDGPGDPSQTQRLATNVSKYNPYTHSRCMFDCASTVAHSLGDGTFVNPGLDTFGNSGINTYRGPRFFSTDLALTKAFTIWENVAVKFRMDAFNAFNHITAGLPGGSIETGGQIGGEGGGCGQGNDCGPRQLEFSLHMQF